MTAGTHLRSGYRPDIDGLRAISILLVVAFHAGVDSFAGGYVGVDVFFVLSGFLITTLLVREQEETSRISLRGFYARRVRRLLPLAFSTIVVTLASGYALVVPLHRTDVLADAVASSLYVANWRFAAQSVAYSDGEVTESLFLHFWSLSVEEQFYLVWPLLIMFAAVVARRAGWRFRPILAWVLGTVSMLSLAVSIISSHQSPDAYYFTHTRVWELGAGAALALALPHLPRLRPRMANTLAWGGLGMIILAGMAFDQETVFPGYAALLPVIGSASLVVAGSRNETVVSRLLSISWMTYIGRISYAWYLWHWPAIGLAAMAADRLGSPLQPSALLAALGVSFGLAALSHTVVEQPIRRSTTLAARPAYSLKMGLALTTIPVLLATSLFVATPTTVVAVESTPNERVAVQDAHDPIAPMTPEQAAADVVALDGRDCHAAFLEVTASSRCVYGRPDGDLSIALVGDSHAQHWLPALDRAGEERNWKVMAWTKDACTAIDVDLYSARLDRSYEECSEWRENVFANLSEIGGVDLVVVADSYGYGSLVMANGRPVENETRMLELWQQGSSRAFARFLQSSSRVALLRDIPWANSDVPECLSVHTDRPRRCSLSLDEAAWRDESFIQAELEAGNQHVVEVDLTKAVCNSDPCPVVTPEGIIKYRDRHHLTQTFSLSLAGGLGEALEPLTATEGGSADT